MVYTIFLETQNPIICHLKKYHIFIYIYIPQRLKNRVPQSHMLWLGTWSSYGGDAEAIHNVPFVVNLVNPTKLFGSGVD